MNTNESIEHTARQTDERIGTYTFAGSARFTLILQAIHKHTDPLDAKLAECRENNLWCVNEILKITKERDKLQKQVNELKEWRDGVTAAYIALESWRPTPKV